MAETSPSTPPKGRFFLITGESYALDQTEVRGVMLDPRSLFFFFITAVLAAILAPSYHIQYDTNSVVIISVFVAYTLFFMSLILLVRAGLYIQRYWPNSMVPVPLVVLLSAVLMEVGLAIFSEHAFGKPAISASRLLSMFLLDYALVLFIEVIFCLYVSPSTAMGRRLILEKNGTGERRADAMRRATDLHPLPVADIPNEPTTSAASVTAQTRHILLGDHQLEVSKIIMMQAQEHYIKVVTEDKNVMVRFRLSDALNLLPPSVGVQVHRSYWVNLAAIQEMKTMPDGRLRLRLTGDNEVMVPRSRKRDVETAVKARS